MDMDSNSRGSACRIKKCVMDLLSIGSDFGDDEESWDLIARDLRLKSTFLYCDFDRIIASASSHQKKPLTELANKLFFSIEDLDRAVNIRSMGLTRDRYNKAAIILQEVVMALKPCLDSEL